MPDFKFIKCPHTPSHILTSVINRHEVNANEVIWLEGDRRLSHMTWWGRRSPRSGPQQDFQVRAPSSPLGQQPSETFSLLWTFILSSGRTKNFTSTTEKYLKTPNFAVQKWDFSHFHWSMFASHHFLKKCVFVTVQCFVWCSWKYKGLLQQGVC